jgi:DNA-3-methyladenine glycosylase II
LPRTRLPIREATAHLCGADPVLGAIVERIGPYEVSLSKPDFAMLARSIVGQQLSGKAAATIYGRLRAALRPHPVNAAGVSRLSAGELRALGLSAQKAGYLLDLAAKTRARAILWSRLPSMEDGEVIEHLTAVKGIGVWTAQMFLMFALGRLDVLPVGDLGIRNAVRQAYGLSEKPRASQLEQLGEKWRPYRTVACWYLWRSLDGEAGFA